MVAAGFANLSGSFFGAYPLGASIGRSAVNANAGSKTPVAVVIAAFFMIFALSVLTPVFYFIPACVLGAIVMGAVIPLLDWRIVPVLWRISKFDLFTLAVSFLVTTIAGVQIGIVTSVCVSLLVSLVTTARPHTSRLGRLPGSVVYRSLARHPFAVTVPGVIVFRFDAQIFFGNAAYLRSVMLRLESELLSRSAGPRALVLDCASVTMIDSTGVQAMREVAVQLAKHDVCTRSDSLPVVVLSASP